MSPTFWREAFETPCTIRIEHTAEGLHAHVELDGGVEVNPGDRVRVHGAPVRLPFGERLELRRVATVARANLAERLWTRARGHFEIADLYEVSFSPGRAR